ncbi:MAG TPA: hypothetical protein VNO55_19810 [Polyangia bacterium]|nr:hypothetical protein [Polyangia bacterium]
MVEVWKVTRFEQADRTNKTVNPYTGSANRADQRKVTTWAARINGKTVDGFATRRSALAAAKGG